MFASFSFVFFFALRFVKMKSRGSLVEIKHNLVASRDVVGLVVLRSRRNATGDVGGRASGARGHHQTSRCAVVGTHASLRCRTGTRAVVGHRRALIQHIECVQGNLRREKRKRRYSVDAASRRRKEASEHLAEGAKVRDKHLECLALALARTSGCDVGTRVR